MLHCVSTICGEALSLSPEQLNKVETSLSRTLLAHF